MNYIDTDNFSETLRDKAIRIDSRELLITNFQNSDQEKDFTEPANCNGFGRVRHFRLGTGLDWPINPLPIYPACHALDVAPSDMIRAQVFQNAICNWRCWYCFVDFKLLSGNKKYSDYLSSVQLVQAYLKEPNPPLMIDLTGGQPDLTPEWIPWMMEALIEFGLEDKVYLWSDDNLSNDYFWKFLSAKQIELVCTYKMYGRVCCFKGINENAFAHNTGTDPGMFERQFIIWERLLRLGIDLYSYITLPVLPTSDISGSVKLFMDRIQNVDDKYLLRIVPLQIQEFSPMQNRIKTLHHELLQGQSIAIAVWESEMRKRFSVEERMKNIATIRTKFQTT